MSRWYEFPHVAFIGRMGAGKTTAASCLQHEFNYRPFRVVGPLKRFVAEVWPGRDEHHRERMLALGRAVRALDEDALLGAALRELDPYLDEDARIAGRIVVDDCRTQAEYRALQARGFKFCRITAPESVREARLQAAGRIGSHDQLHDPDTEGQLDWVDCPVLSNEGSDLELYAKVVSWLNRARERAA